MIIEPCHNCETHIPHGITTRTDDGESFTATTDYCPICGAATVWGEENEL
mgnify:CR=1 FL=1